jgi:hypothetical protein
MKVAHSGLRPACSTWWAQRSRLLFPLATGPITGRVAVFL